MKKTANGGELSWNPENNKVVMSGNTSDKCYVYFVKVNIITFTINDTEYKAIEGMTWGEWINSDYNINFACGLSDSGKVVFKVTGSGFYYLFWKGKDSSIFKEKLIVENREYLFSTSSRPEIE